MPHHAGFNKRSTGERAQQYFLFSFLCVGILLSSMPARGAPANTPLKYHQLAVPILGVTLDQAHRPMGIVTHVVIHFEQRPDHNGLQLRFRVDPGRFSPYAQHAVTQAIARACQAAHIQLDSLTIYLTFPYQGLTMYGDSLSAMVGLSVVAMAKGDMVIFGRAITGTITEDGHIGAVGGIPYKVEAAYAEHMNRIVIPEERDSRDDEWQTPFMMQVSPVSTLDKAYHVLTGHKLQ
jgi:Lon protease (S16) C-terminal proteolytic domain